MDEKPAVQPLRIMIRKLKALLVKSSVANDWVKSNSVTTKARTKPERASESFRELLAATAGSDCWVPLLGAKFC